MKPKKSISDRITKAVLMTCVITLLISAVFSTIARIRLQNLLTESGNEIGSSASEMSAETLLEKSVSASQDFISAKVEVLDGYLKNIKDNMTIMQSRAAELFENDVDLYDGLSVIAESIMRLNNDIFSMYIVTENGDILFFGGYAPEIPDNLILTERPWYLAAKEKGAVSITDTYEDALGRGLCITFSIPVYNRNGDLMGVIGADIGMRELSNAIIEMTASGVEFVILAGENGVIASPILGEVEGAELLPPGMEAIFESRNGAMTLAVPVIAVDEPIYIESYIVWDTFTLTDWKLIGFTPIDSIIAPAEEMRESINKLTDSAIDDAQVAAMATAILTLVALIGVLIFGMIYARRTAKRISAPIMSLTESAVKIGQGELERELVANTGDEIQTLAETINKMVADIKQITGEKERIGAELDVATKIQASMLPCIFPAFPDCDEFDIYAAMYPAKEVGGDFYDFFMIDDNKLAIVAADVSGKGIPAALFMVISKTLIKNNAQYGKSPKDVFETVNKLLCENNMARMFVTAFMGFLELDTGKFTFVNAGHNPPLIKRNGGDYEFLKTKPGFVLAGMKKTKYREETITLSAGDMLYLYTDGVTEAMNPKRELFSDPKLLEVANIHKDVDLNEFIAHIKGEVDLFADGAEQADDITMVILRVLENSKSKELSISAEVENLPQVWGFVNSELEKVNAEPKLMRQVKTAVEEIFVNIAHYAYNPETGVAVVRVSVGDEIVIEFEDSGIAYNPLEREPPNVTLAAKERQIGGLGVHMVKKIMDSVEYRYEGGKNILKIGKKVVENK